MASSFMSVGHSDGVWTCEFADEAIWQIRLDYAVTLVSEHVEARIERDFELLSRGERLRVTPDSPSGVAPVVALHRAPLTRVDVSSEGALRMSLDDAHTIVVPPSSSAYEAFDLVIEGGWKFVSMPGGGLTVWSGEA